MRNRILLFTAIVALGILNTSFNTAGELKGQAGKSDKKEHPGTFSSSYFLTVNSLLDLKKLKPTADGQLVTMTYKLVSSDNCGGQFEWDAYSTAKPDDALVVQSSQSDSLNVQHSCFSQKHFSGPASHPYDYLQWQYQYCSCTLYCWRK